MKYFENFFFKKWGSFSSLYLQIVHQQRPGACLRRVTIGIRWQPIKIDVRINESNNRINCPMQICQSYQLFHERSGLARVPQRCNNQKQTINAQQIQWKCCRCAEHWPQQIPRRKTAHEWGMLQSNVTLCLQQYCFKIKVAAGAETDDKPR